MSEGSVEKNLPQLTGQEGYKEWARQMKGYLMMIDAWELTEGTETAPATDAKDEEKKDWKKRNARACGILMHKTSIEVAKCYEGKSTAR